MELSTSLRNSIRGGKLLRYAVVGSLKLTRGADRPKEHHVYDILYYIKASFKKHALDQIKEGDCLNREAFR
jgi:hypothetical protein